MISTEFDKEKKKNKIDMSLMCSNELLLCADACPEVAPVAARDPAIMTDRRVLQQLLGLEIFSLPSSDYFAPPTELQPYMRRVVTTWMLEVCVGNSVWIVWTYGSFDSANRPIDLVFSTSLDDRPCSDLLRKDFLLAHTPVPLNPYKINLMSI